MTSLIVATSNPGKLIEMQTYLSGLGWELELKPDELEVEETGSSFYENACLKASEVAKATGKWAIADDSGLEVDALGGEPGIYSGRYAKTDLERIKRLLADLGNAENRHAKFTCVLALARPDGSIAITTEGICEGEILREMRGNQSFGYDPIFYVPDKGMTFAEMTTEEKRSVSHRGQAFTHLIPLLEKLER